MMSLIKSVTLLMLAFAPLSSMAASIKVDFEEFAYGTSIGDYYNHGKDSLNRASGSYYGITFSGGTIKATPSGNYLAGATTLTIDPAAVRALLGTTGYYVSFNAGVYYQQDYRSVYVTSEDGFTEPSAYIPGNSTPDCRESNGCVNLYYGTMGGYYVVGAYTPAPIRIQFPTDRLDNLTIHSLNGHGSLVAPQHIYGTYELHRDIPEPTSFALLGIGAAALLARRYRNSYKAPANFR